jgi:type II secretory pathway component GspD/PulD (secretin)
MSRLMRCLLLVLCVAPVPSLHAQVKEDSLVVRTYALKSMTASDAAKLVAPYIRSPRGGVFDVGGARSITVRDFAPVLRTVDSLLAVYDRAPAVVRLTFQLIATSDSATRDPAIAPIENALRGIFRFNGYRLLTQTTAVVREMGNFHSTVSADGRRYIVTGSLSRVTPGADGTVRLDVSLDDVTSRANDIAQAQARAMLGGGRVLSTDLTAPLGQTVVLGSGAPEDGGRILILVVRAELQPPAGR